ncbi:MAG: glycosyltransferase [Bacteroides sp.]|nr:glycosyltransferase [Bacteroides sp.]
MEDLARDSGITPRATIIILTYNQEHTIRRAIESVLRQECRFPYEILIADDASTDGTRRICEEYASRYPRLIRLMPEAPNKGLVGNYFDAVATARGEYIGDCAGDDEWLGRMRLQMAIEVLDRETDVSVVFTDVEVVTPTGRQLRSADPRTSRWYASARHSGRVVLESVLNHTDSIPYILSSALYRRSAVISPQWPSGAPPYDFYSGNVEDLPVIAACALAGDAVMISERGYRYYADGVSISNNLSHEKEYRFLAPVTSLMRRLGKACGYTPETQMRFFRAKFPYMAAQIRHSGLGKELRTDFRNRLREWGLPLPLRGKAHLWLSYFK